MDIGSLINLKEAEDKVEFKEAKGGSYSYNGSGKTDPKDRRKCILGYVIAFANECGGKLVFGMSDRHPHKVVGTNQNLGTIGELTSNIYRDTKIRVNIEELSHTDGSRVVVIDIPSRPKGKVYKYDDVALMRVGEELLPMSDEVYFKIIREQEPDFSEQYCEGITIDDLDPVAIKIMAEAYAKKQDNPQFLTHTNEQILSDLELVFMGKVTYAALILLGKKEVIKAKVPQASVNWEYRNSDGQIVFDKREFYQESYYTMLDKLWDTIDARNGKVPVQQGPYIFDIPFFNKEVIRESLNNAITHRDYYKHSEVIIKQYPDKLIVLSPGGFPSGVTLQNLLTVNSTPRNRRLADILQKTGIVERSGQGVDKIFYQCITEAKGIPDYSNSDDFQVELCLPAYVKDKAFALFISQVQKERGENDRLNLKEIITLEKIRIGIDKSELDVTITDKLLANRLIEKIGKTRQLHYQLSKEYYSFIDQRGVYSRQKPIDEAHVSMMIKNHLKEFKEAKMKDFSELLGDFLTREQVKTFVYKMVNTKILERNNQSYKLGKKAHESEKLVERVIELGIEELKKRGEFPPKEE